MIPQPDTRLATLARSGLVKPGEYWSFLPQFPAYAVGAHGEVISLLQKTPRKLRPIKMSDYDGYQLKRADGKTVHVYRHRLVAEAFHGPCPEGQECRHLDGDKSNCDFTNLRWGTRTENSHDKIACGTAPVGERHPAAKLTEAAVRDMKRMRAEGLLYREIAAKFNVSTMAAYRAVNGQLWKMVA